MPQIAKVLRTLKTPEPIRVFRKSCETGVGLNGRDLRPEAKTEEVLQDIIFSVIELVHACLLIRTFRRNLKRFTGRGELR